VSGWATPLIVVALGAVNVLIAVWRRALWFGSGSILTTLGGLMLLVSTAVKLRTPIPSYLAASLLIVSVFFYVVSIIKREMRVTL
jgi:hypothetical protein